jgi:hypothetical protein
MVSLTLTIIFSLSKHSNLDVIKPVGHGLSFNLAEAYVVFKSVKALRLNDLDLKADEEVDCCFAPELA